MSITIHYNYSLIKIFNSSFTISDCKDGDVRLSDGPTNNEGTVEMCYNNIWGLVDESGWGLSDAKVVCSQLRYGSKGGIHNNNNTNNNQYQY